MSEFDLSPLPAHADHHLPSVFTAENLLREARRQKGLAPLPVPSVCVLDPDGDLVAYLRRTQQVHRHCGWACYHTELDVLPFGDREVGLVRWAVGAPFAVLVAEELFASGCRLLLSITSAGRITPIADPPYYVLIDRALRDEGASWHYVAAAPFAQMPQTVEALATVLLAQQPVELLRGATWTTDAPFRETQRKIDRALAAGILAVEMEAAALYAFAQARAKAVLCFAHVTNQMAQNGDDFEKGIENGAQESLALIQGAVQAWNSLAASPEA